jgi:heterodisulfide reductase subunit A-like polyferredoxin
MSTTEKDESALVVEETRVIQNTSDEKIIGSVLVTGGGISGIQSSLDLADAGFKVYIVEKGPSIGGTMPQLDKTFPTNDCAMCILGPKLVATGRHRNIEIISKAEVCDIKGNVGNFQVTIKKHPRFVDMEKCNGCGDCVEHCPVNILSDFNEGLEFRKAIYQPFPQAIPNVFAIDKSIGISPCKLECPAKLNAQGFIALASQEKFAEAYTLIKEKIPLPGSLGRICYHPCEKECNRKDIEEPVSICKIRRFIADYIYEHPKELENYLRLKEEKNESKENEKTKRGKNRKVAIIGAGPAGLTAASDLSKMGYKPTIFEAEKHNGGMLYYGVPQYRLPKDYLESEINRIIKEDNIEIKNNQKFGKDFYLKDLRKQGFKAIFLAIGTQKSRSLKMDGCENKCVLQGLEYLKNLNRDKIPNDYFKGKRVLVLGGGNVAMDSARTAKRLGGDVTVVYRRTLNEMPAYQEEIAHAKEENIKFRFLTSPLKVLSKAKDTCLRCVKMELGEPDSSGRRKPIEIIDSEFDILTDVVIIAFGQEIEDKPLEKNSIKLNDKKLIDVDLVTYQTSQKDVFAGGDSVTGPASAVEAIGAGHDVAVSIDRYLNNENLLKGREKDENKKAEIPSNIPRFPKQRECPSQISIEKRMNSFDEVEFSFTKEQAVREAQRCINCAGCCECLQCVEYCGRDAIDHNMEEMIETINVGSVILSPGSNKYLPPKGDSYGYKVYPNVLTSIEFERMLSASGPYKGHIKRVSDGKPPKKIAWLQCIGSRDESCDRPYCSAVCCMYATKEAVIAKEHQPGVDTHIYFMDMRSFGKDFEKYYNRAKDEHGVLYRRCKIPRIEQDRETKNLRIRYVDTDGKTKQETYDMVVLSVGLQPCESLGNLSEIFDINLNQYGFIETNPYLRDITSRKGIYTSGTVTEPKDIPESVTQASAAAAEAAKDITTVRGTDILEKEYPAEKDISKELPKIGVFVCHCGINIAGIVDVKKVVESVKKLPNVVYANDGIYTCSQDSLEDIKKKIKEFDLNRIVVASCTPRTHEPLFQDTLHEAGLNPHLFEMANIRDQNSWVHKDSPEKATKKAIDVVRMAIAKASELFPVYHFQTPVVHNALVIGGGIAGMQSALSIADQGYKVFLVEKENELGGHLKKIFLGVGKEKPQDLLKETIQRTSNHPNIEVFTGTEIESVTGYVGNFNTKLKSNKKKDIEEINHGVIIVATGGIPYEPVEYHYNNDNIVKQTDFEKDLFDNKTYLKNLKEIVMIQCVGSRNDERPYCSRICCSEAINNALKLKEINPDVEVYILYRDIRTYGFKEDLLYSKARKKGIIFIRFEDDVEPKVELHHGKITVKTKDLILGQNLILHPDKLVLSTGVVPRDNTKLTQQLKIPLNEDNFYAEAHVKLRPVDFSVDGIYLCGLAHSPRFIEESILQAKATGARAATILSKPYLETKGNIAHISSRNCAGCKLCIDVCSYDAIGFDEERRIVKVNEILCQGCGACSAICPSGVSQQNTFTKKQVISMIDACLE